MPRSRTALRCGALTALVCAALLRAVPAPADAEDDWKLARNLFRELGDYATAAQLFADFIRNHPGDSHLPDARLNLARSYARSGRCEEALPAYETFFEEYREHLDAADARREHADCLQQLGRFEAAGAAFETVQRLYSEGEYAADALLSAAANYRRAGDVANAVRAYAKLSADYPGRAATHRGWLHLAQLRFAAGDPVAAHDLLSSIWEAAPKSQTARDALLLAGNIHLFLGRTAAAAAVFRDLHAAFPSSAQSDSARLALAAHHLDRGRYEEAATAYRDAAGRIDDGDLKAQAQLGRADALRLSGDYETALSAYESLADSLDGDDPVAARAFLGRAIALGQAGRFVAAVSWFLQLVQVQSDGLPTPVSAAATRELGALYRRQGDLARATSWFRRYLDEAERSGTKFPESAAEADLTRLHLAQVYDAGGYHDDAVRLFSRLSRGAGPLAAEAQFGLAAAYEGSGARRLAIGEFRGFLDRFSGHPRAAQVRQRVEYLAEYTIADADGLSQALQQAFVDGLSGVSRRQVLLDVAQALRSHQDFPNAVRAWETYVASYGGDPTTAEAQFYLADCLYRLARQRQLEGLPAAGDSLHALALQEDAILADTDAGRWSRLAQLRRVESEAASVSGDARLLLLETGYGEFLQRNPLTEDSREARARALLGLADARRQAAADDSSRLARADSIYVQLLTEAAGSPLAPTARFGRASVALHTGDTETAIDSLSALVPRVSGSRLQPRVLATLGVALARAGRHGEAATRLGELLLAFPDFDGRRQAQELLADTYLQLRQSQRAGELFARLAASDPNGDVSGSLRTRQARSLHLAGDYLAALGVYDRLLAEGAGALDSVQLARGRLLARLGRTDDAVAAYGRVRGALAPAAALGAADLHFHAGHYEAAWQAYQPRLDDDDARADVVGRAVVCLYELGRGEEADRWSQKHRKRFGDDGAWPYLLRLYKGRYLLARREWDKAQKQFSGVAEDAAEKPAQADFADGSGDLLARMAVDPAGAGAFFAATAEWERMRTEPSEEGTARALQAQSNFVKNHPGSPFTADVRLRLGQFYETMNTLFPAAGAYADVVNGPHGTRAQRQEAIYRLLRCYSRLSQWDQALRVARRIEVEHPRHPSRDDVQLEIGYILMQTGQYGPAIAQLERVLEWARGEDAAEARFYIGEAHERTNDYRQAIKAYSEVAFHGADASTDWINSADVRRARCYERLGELDAAVSTYERIIQREGAGSEYGRHARESIDAIRGVGG